MKSILLKTCVLLCALALAVPAYAEGGGGKRQGGKKGRRAGQLFEKFDKNKDGALTSDEVPENCWTKISRADADGDGAVTKAELKKARRDRKGKRKGKGAEGARGR